jgi:hypothetical protein
LIIAPFEDFRGQDMSNRVRIFLACLILLFLGIEVAVRLSSVPKMPILVVNKGDTLLENLVVSFAGSQVGVGDLPSGGSSTIWLSGRQKGSLSLSFKQQGNPLQGFQVADFNPGEMRRDGLKMVLQIKSNEVEKYMDDDDTSTVMGRLGDRLQSWIAAELSLGR